MKSDKAVLSQMVSKRFVSEIVPTSFEPQQLANPLHSTRLH
jgi:hypothetical protein